MKTVIDAAIDRTRTMVLLLVFLLVAGGASYVAIPKEASPDVQIPTIYVRMAHEGISPEDAERMLVRPMEQELAAIEGVEEMEASAYEGGASVTLEFDAGFDPDEALADVREKVDIAKAELPEETEEPIVQEVNVALFPILTVALAGQVPERTLVDIARDLRDRLESLGGVLSVDIAGNREEQVEIVIDPLLLETYRISQSDLVRFVSQNNQLVPAGTLDAGTGQLAVKVPGVFENVEDVLNLPVKSSGDRVVRFRDIALVRRGFKDRNTYARVDGQPAITLNVTKRVGANIIDTVDQVRASVERVRGNWPEQVSVSYLQDQSEDVESMLTDLQNNVLMAVLLVAIVIVGVLGLRTAGLVGVAIPGSFVIGILALSTMGLTVNIVVLFALIMAVGMLVDGAIVVTELADRRMAEGLTRKEAYRAAAKRMAWPIIASTATTLAAFMPLLFWPGTTGEFMKFLPITLIATLSASLLMALIFVPTLGGLIGRSGAVTARARASLTRAESGDLSRLGGGTSAYLRFMRRALAHPWRVLGVATLVLIGSFVVYGLYGHGTEFFPDVEPDLAVVQVRARGDMSVDERDRLVRQVEDRVLKVAGVETLYSVTQGSGAQQQGGGGDAPRDLIGQMQLEFYDWKYRERSSSEVLAEIRRRTADIPGIIIEIREPRAGPSGDEKPIQIELSSDRPVQLESAVARVRDTMAEMGGFQDVDDSRPLPGIEWQVKVDRERAARYGADVALVGSFVQMVTNGIKLGEYRPDDTDEEIDIRVRFPYAHRNLTQLKELRVRTPDGVVPVGNFVQVLPAPKVETIERVDQHRVYSIGADVIPRPGEALEEGALANKRIDELQARLPQLELPESINVAFKGRNEDQREAMSFLGKAFVVALFVMALILVTQFNSFYQALLILTAVAFSTGGVLLGLLVLGQPFGVVMSGVGVIALAGIVVNNNIVLIDTFNILRRQGMSALEAVLRTGAQRLRPVVLTTLTTILGLLPMVLGLNINLLTRQITIGAPAMQWWVQLASAVAGGLGFATLLTLVLTPALLYLQARRQDHRAGLAADRVDRVQQREQEMRSAA